MLKLRASACAVILFARGFIPGAPILEVSSAHPKLGAVFYTLQQKPAEKPHLTRTDQCLECHASSKNLGVPGHLVRSFVTDEDGVVDLASGISPITHRTALTDRWGGWYVTGTHGAQVHRGNLIGKAAFARQWFANQGPTDGQGRSLRQFDLNSRLFKYPCSFLIYSEPF